MVAKSPIEFHVKLSRDWDEASPFIPWPKFIFAIIINVPRQTFWKYVTGQLASGHNMSRPSFSQECPQQNTYSTWISTSYRISRGSTHVTSQRSFTPECHIPFITGVPHHHSHRSATSLLSPEYHITILIRVPRHFYRRSVTSFISPECHFTFITGVPHNHSHPIRVPRHFYRRSVTSFFSPECHVTFIAGVPRHLYHRSATLPFLPGWPIRSFTPELTVTSPRCLLLDDLWKCNATAFSR